MNQVMKQTQGTDGHRIKKGEIDRRRLKCGTVHSEILRQSRRLWECLDRFRGPTGPNLESKFMKVLLDFIFTHSPSRAWKEFPEPTAHGRRHIRRKQVPDLTPRS